jgi:PKD repeat protein
VRPAGSENYVVDSSTFTTNNGYSTEYPWHRERLIEDCIEIVDAAIDFDDFTDAGAMNTANYCEGPMTVNRSSDLAGDPFDHQTRFPEQFATGDKQMDILTGAGILSGIVLLPPGAPGSAGSNVEGQGFPNIGPDFWPIHTEDGLGDEKYEDANLPRSPDGEDAQLSLHLFSHDLVLSLPMQPEAENFLTATVVNCPMAGFDAEAEAGLVHPSPPFKQFSCTEWVQPVDLRTVLTPGVPATVTLPPAELVRDDSYYYIENEAREGERLYLWSAGTGFDEPDHPGSGGMPEEGVLILHADPGANPEATPVQQNFPPFSYTVVQADGLDELGAGRLDNFFCEDVADAGDVWPGSTESTTFTCDTLPASLWNSGVACTGLEISNVVLDGHGGAMVTMTWMPQEIPSLAFVDPPGGVTVPLPGNTIIYDVRADVTDLFGGTWLRFFYVPDGAPFEIKTDGSNFIGMAQKLLPGRTELSVEWNIADVNDGRYRVFAELIPGESADGPERPHSEPRAGRNNVGQSTLKNLKVDTGEVRAFGTSGTWGTDAVTGKTTFEATDDSGDPVIFDTVEVGDQLTVRDAGAHESLLRVVDDVVAGNTRLVLQEFVPGSFDVSSWLVVRGTSGARFETWTVTLAKLGSRVQTWEIFSTLTQPPPDTKAGEENPWEVLEIAVDPTTNEGSGDYESAGGEVAFTLDVTGMPFKTGDTWSFTTTGITPLSKTVMIEDAQINEAPTAVIFASPLSGPPPLKVAFDGRGSFDPNGAALEYLWDFGDSSAPAAGVAQEHIYTQARTFTAKLTVTNPTGLFGEASVDIVVTNNSPKARLAAAPLSGPDGLKVTFDASQSSDPESEADELVYQWNFGDGDSGNAGADPGILITTTHFYAVDEAYPCTRENAILTFLNAQIGVGDLAEALKGVSCYTAILTVSDHGEKSDTAEVDIEVGNNLPVHGITATPTRGPAPLEVVFNAIGSFDPDPADQLWVLWDWTGDGSAVEGPYPLIGRPGTTDGSVSHEYTSTGDYTATAKVFDSKGGYSKWSGEISVSDETVGESEPKAEMRVLTPQPLVVDVPFAVDAYGSFDRPLGNTLVQYRWDWGDGSEEAIGYLATHMYGKTGRYWIELQVFDGENPPNAGRVRREVSVVKDPAPLPGDNTPPTALFVVRPDVGGVGETFNFDAGSSTDSDGDKLSYVWDFGDRTSGVGETISHEYTVPGTYTVRLTVRDTHGASSTARPQTVLVTPYISNRPPVAWIGMGQRSGTAPFFIRFDGTNSYDPDDPDGDEVDLTFEWYVNDEVVGTDPVLVYTFTIAGEYPVQLKVSDGQDVGVSEVQTVVVSPSGTTPGETEPERPVSGGGGGGSSGGFCGLGMVTALAGSLLGLFVMMATRRRFPL